MCETPTDRAKILTWSDGVALTDAEICTLKAGGEVIHELPSEARNELRCEWKIGWPAPPDDGWEGW